MKIELHDNKKATSEIIVLRYVRQNVLTKSTGPWHSTWYSVLKWNFKNKYLTNSHL